MRYSIIGKTKMSELFTLNEIAAMRREQGLETVLCFIDVAKAYDKCGDRGSG